MNLYKTTGTVEEDFGQQRKRVHWSGTQADARADRKTFKEQGVKNIESADVVVPVAKGELLDWLNKNNVDAS